MLDVILNILLETLKFGIPYAILALGVFISFRVLDFADMTTEGTYVFGGAITVVCIVLGVNPWLATILSVVGGVLAGIISGGLFESKEFAERKGNGKKEKGFVGGKCYSAFRAVYDHQLFAERILRIPSCHRL